MRRTTSNPIEERGGRLRAAFERLTHKPGATQRKLLLAILARNKTTEYGRLHAFASIQSPEAFRRRVPIVEYPALEPYVERMKAGEDGVLTADPVYMFSLTSGTSARPKFIPVTRAGHRRTKLLLHQWLARVLADHRMVLDGRLLCISGAAIEGYCAGGIPYGSASGMIYTTLPGIPRTLFAAPFGASAIADYGLRYHVLARLALEQDLSFIATPSPLTIINMVEAGVERADDIIRSVHNGWLTEAIRDEAACRAAGIPPEILRRVRPNRRRAATLEAVRAGAGSLPPAACWPRLALVGCWLGGSIGFHVPALRRHFGTVPFRDIGYMASEGCMALPVADETPAGVLAIENHYYEFIPEAQADTESPDLLEATDVREGDCYRIVLTNENGLYRYDIGDIVRVDGFYNRAPVVSFVRKSGQVTSIAGEKLHLNHVLAAIERLQALHGKAIRQFRVTPDPIARRYDVFLALDESLAGDFVRGKPQETFDRLLCEANIEYAAKRASKRLGPPLVHVMDANWVDHVTRAGAQSGQRDAQFKWIHLAAARVEPDYRHIRYSITPRGA